MAQVFTCEYVFVLLCMARQSCVVILQLISWFQIFILLRNHHEFPLSPSRVNLERESQGDRIMILYQHDFITNMDS